MNEPRHRLIVARTAAGYDSPSDAARAFREINKNTLISHENGNRPLSRKAADKYGRLFKVSPGWLLFGEGQPEGEPPPVADVPLISWVSAGELSDQDTVVDFAEFPIVTAADLPDGNWIALRVDGPSMNKISPPESVIFVNLKDKRLVPNGLYIIADETGSATYKRYRPNEKPPFQPASYEPIEPPALQGAVKVIGRVRRSVIET